MLLPEFLYMAEASGRDDLVSTREAKINAVINDLKDCIRRGIDIRDSKLQEDICGNHGLQLEKLTRAEIRRIENAL